MTRPASSHDTTTAELRELPRPSWPGMTMVGLALVCIATAAWGIYRIAAFNELHLSLIHI